jgi:hypothetical protein
MISPPQTSNKKRIPQNKKQVNKKSCANTTCSRVIRREKYSDALYRGFLTAYHRREHIRKARQIEKLNELGQLASDKRL